MPKDRSRKWYEEALGIAIEQYFQAVKDGAGNKKLAELENHIWEGKQGVGFDTPENGELDPNKRRRSWLVNTLGGSSSEYECRFFLLLSGSWTDILFDKWDKKQMSANMVGNVARSAKRLAKKYQKPPEEILEKLLKQYKGTVKSIEDVEEFTAFTDSEGNGHADTAKELKKQVHQVALEYLSKALEEAGAPEDSIRKVYEEFKQGVDPVLRDLFRNITQAKKQEDFHTLSMKVSRTAFIQACEVVGLVSVYGKPLSKNWDWLRPRIAKRAATFHPDTNPSHEEEYRRLIKAQEVLGEYVKQFGSIPK